MKEVRAATYFQTPGKSSRNRRKFETPARSSLRFRLTPCGRRNAFPQKPTNRRPTIEPLGQACRIPDQRRRIATAGRRIHWAPLPALVADPNAPGRPHGRFDVSTSPEEELRSKCPTEPSNHPPHEQEYLQNIPFGLSDPNYRL